VLLAQGEKAEARRELREALARGPSDEERNEIRALLTQFE
jgi:Tfp pilus assembly protein PilF